MNELPYYVGFSYFLGIGPIRFRKLKDTYPNLKEAYYAPLNELQELIGITVSEKFIAFRNTFDINAELEKIEHDKVQVLTQEDKRYPTSFRNLEDSPICLYVRGDLDQFNFQEDRFFGVVGTRKPTPYGIQVTELFTKGLVESGFTIVSGMALGVDAIAHQTALDARGKTVAILGCGVQIVYPPSNKRLYDLILEGQGIILSEFPPYMSVKPGLFISRNRLVSGLSKGVLVTEGLKQSGSIITARFASEQGKDVFSVPGQIFSEQSQAPHYLIRQGAKLVTQVEDILEEFGMTTCSVKNVKELHLSPEEQMIYESLIQGTQDGDEIASRMSRPIYEVMTLISGLEIQGIIEKNEMGKYQIKR